MLVVQPALASTPKPFNPARTYVAARAAALSGDHARSAQLLAELVDSQSSSQAVTREAVSEAIGAGAIGLALRLTGKLPTEAIPIEARLLLIAEDLRRGKGNDAIARLTSGSDVGNVAFLAPLLSAWVAADRRDLKSALAYLDRVDAANPLSTIVPEQRALILLKYRRIAEAQPFVDRALEKAGGREPRLRLAFADAYLAAGDRPRAQAMIAPVGAEVGQARTRIMTGRPSGQAIDKATTAYAELLLRLAIDLNRLSNQSLPVALAQIARHSDPNNSSAPILLGIFLNDRDRTEAALEAFRSVPAEDGLAGQALDSYVRTLAETGRRDLALARARDAASSPTAGASDFARYGDVLESMDRHADAAAAYGRALQLIPAASGDQRWPLLLLQASALEAAGRWPESRQALASALALAPNEPLILNFLGYSKLERGEDLDSAEAMIRRASELAPNDPSITDSLGWAMFKRGHIDQAIETLQAAARKDPLQSEIHEHLGDALYTAGRKFEARFAWHAALATAEDEELARLQAKIDTGLTRETAAP